MTRDLRRADRLTSGRGVAADLPVTSATHGMAQAELLRPEGVTSSPGDTIAGWVPDIRSPAIEPPGRHARGPGSLTAGGTDQDVIR